MDDNEIAALLSSVASALLSDDDGVEACTTFPSSGPNPLNTIDDTYKGAVEAGMGCKGTCLEQQTPTTPGVAQDSMMVGNTDIAAELVAVAKALLDVE